MAEPRYQCKFCGTRFVHENRYLKHHCKQMKREELFQQPLGQAAWIFYQQWMRSYNKIAHNAKAFLHSKYYNSFVRFAEFVKQVKIPEPEAYILLMREHDISPTIWTNDQVYTLFLEHMDRKVAPEKHAEITINTMFDFVEDHEVSIEHIFEVMQPSDIVEMLRQRRLSPWILLNSPKFTKFYKEKTSVDDRIMIESIIRPKYWKEKFQKHPDVVEQMRLYVKELKL